jgi:4,4'-diaponeurosporenoate glycosyltransferase
MLIFLAATVVLWVAGFLLLPRLRPCRDDHRPPRDEKVSIIIPARDEAHNLPNLLASLSTQSIQPHEIIVVDDGSTDRTAVIAAEMGASVIASESLPDGWRGKPWACHQGAARAVGDLFCFVDADTTFAEGGLERMLSCYTSGAFSVGPWHAVEKSYENLSLFFNLNMVAGTVPDGLFGQMLLVDRASYHQVGGHESVRGLILENFRLAEFFRTKGIEVSSAAGRGVLAFRMYPGGIRDLIEGWTKGFASGAGRTPRAVLLLLIFWMSGMMCVPVGLVLSGAAVEWVLAYLACAGQVAWFARRVGGFHWHALLFYPVPLVFFFGLFARSAMRSGKNVTWKGREIRAD